MIAKRLAGILVVGAVATLSSACGGDSEPVATSDDEGPLTVVLKDIEFKPGTLTVKSGDTVTWKFEDKGIPHNVVANDESFKSDIKDAGVFKHTFEKPGTFSYSCTVHPGMNGTVKVS